MPKIQNVRWGLTGEPGQPCLYFDLDGRPASAFWEQKQGVLKQGLIAIDFEDDKPSHLPKIDVLDEDGNIIYQSDVVLRSDWLIERWRRMLYADKFDDGRIIGDAPVGA